MTAKAYFVPRLVGAAFVCAAACGDASSSSDLPPAPTPPTSPTGSDIAPPPEPPAEPVGEPVDLLHSVPTAIAVSSAYRGEAAQVLKLVDGDYETAWNSRSGDLVGAWIDIRLPDDATVSSMAITVGFTKRGDRTDLFEGNHRVAKVRVLREGQELGVHELDTSSRELQPLPVEAGGGVYRIEVVEVQTGSRTDWRETCVSELRVMGRAPGVRGGQYAPRTGVGELPALGPPEETSHVATAGDEMYFVLQEGPHGWGGLVRLGADRQFTRIRDRGTKLVVAPDDSLYLSSSNRSDQYFFEALSGSDPPVPVDSALSWVMGIAPLTNGRLWAVGLRGAGYYDGSTWSVTPREAIGRDLRDIAVDADGVVWVLGTAGIYRRTDDAFEEVEVTGVDAAHFNGFVATPGGAIVVQHARGLLRFERGAWVAVGPAIGPIAVAAYRADGALIVAKPRSAELVLALSGGDRRTIDLAALDVPARSVGALAWDGAGRVWASTNVGIAVVSSDLTTLARWYPAGSVPELRGGVRALVARGNGPALPQPRPTDGRVRGRVMHDGQPIAGAFVELCADPTRGNMGSMGTPCEAQPVATPYHGAARTRDDGSFELFEVPPGRYYLAIPLGNATWHVTRTSPCCGRLRPGQTYDMGTIEAGPANTR